MNARTESMTEEAKMKMDDVLAEVVLERERQEAKWGPQNWTALAWLAILAEEFGEVSKDVVEATFARTPEKRRDELAKARVELVQTAAVAVAIVEALDLQARKEAEAICPHTLFETQEAAG